MKRETVIVLDFGGQYNQLIARRVRECNVYCEIYSYKTDIEKIKEIQPKGIIFTFVLETGADRVKIRFTKNAISSVEKLNMDNAPKK